MDYPQLAQLYALLSNPITFGILISLIWEQTSLFKDDKASPLLKIAIVTLTGLLWSLVIAALSPTGLPQTPAAWYPVLMMGIAVAASTQIFHQLVNNYFPALGDLLLALRIGPTPEAQPPLRMPEAQHPFKIPASQISLTS